MPTLEELVAKATKTVLQKYEIKPGCDAEVKMAESCSITFISEPDACLTVTDLTEKLLGKNSDMASKILSAMPSGVSLKSAEVDRCLKTFDMSIGVQTNYTLVKDIVTLNGVHIWVKLFLKPPNLYFNITGIWMMQNFRFSVSVVRSSDGIDISGVQIPLSAQTSLSNIIFAVGNKFIPVTQVQDVVSKIRFDAVVVSQVSLISRFVNNSSALRISFTILDASLGNPMVHLTLVKSNTATPSTGATIACKFRNIRLSSLLKRLVRIDISGVPILGTSTFQNLAMILSTTNLETPIIDYNDPYFSELVPVGQGLQMVTEIKFTSQSSIVKVKLAITRTLIEFRVLGDSGLSVKKFIEMLIINLGNISLPPKFNLNKFMSVKLVSFEYDSSTKTYTLPVVLPESIIFVPKAVELENATIIFKVRRIPLSTGIQIQSMWELGSLSIPLNISKPLGLSVFCAVSRPPVEIPFGAMIKQFLVGILPSGPLETAVKKAGFDGFYVKQPYLKIYLVSNRHVVVRLSGTAVIGVWDKCQVEILLGQVREAFVMATGIVLENVPITQLIYKVTDKRIDLRNIPGASILDNTDVAISMASQNVPKTQKYMQFSIPALGDVEILDGVILMTSFKFPADCKNDIGCTVFKRLIGPDAQLVLKGRLFIATVYIAATVPTQIQLFKGVNISDVGLELEAGPTRNSIGIWGTLKLRNPPLTFIGSFGISTGGVFLQMSMAGLWRKPFEIPVLAVGDLHLRVAVSPLPGFITVIEFGGRGMIGSLDNSRAKLINVSMYFGIDQVSPLENFFYGSATPFTIKSILEAFGKSVSLPRALSNSGFPKGVNVSFAMKTKVLPNGVTVVRGFFMQGMIKILSFEASADLKINLNGFWINLTVKPFNIANGLIAISGRSATSGPRILVDVGWNPPRAYIIIEGSVQILRIRSTTNVTISTRGISFEVSGAFLGLFEAGLKVTTRHSNVKTADFQVSGYFTQSLLQTLEREAQKALNEYKQRADRAINSAKDKVNNAKKAFDRAADNIASLRGKVYNQKAKCDAAIRSLESKKRYFEDKKKIFDDASAKLRSARNKLSEKQRDYDDAVKKRADKLKKGCPSDCRKSK